MALTGHIFYGGGIHGLYQIIGEYKKKYVDKWNAKFHAKTESFSYKLGQTAITFFLTSIAWVFFRSSSITEAFDYIYRMFTRWNFWQLFKGVYAECGLNTIQFTVLLLSLIVLLVSDCIKYKTGNGVVQFLETQTIWFRWGIYLMLFMSILIFGIYGPDMDNSQFIYFQF